MASAPVPPGGVEDALDVEIALARGRRPDQHRLVGVATWGQPASASEYTATVRMPRARQRAEDPAGDLPAVGDEDALRARSSGGRARREAETGLERARPASRRSAGTQRRSSVTRAAGAVEARA